MVFLQLQNIKGQKSLKLLPFEKILNTDKYYNFEMTYIGYDCKQSNPSMLTHEMYYWDAFYYIWNWVQLYGTLEYTEIPVNNLKNITERRNVRYDAHDQCGELIFFGLRNNLITMAYNDAVIKASYQPWDIFPKNGTTTTSPYYRAECAHSDRILHATQDDLDAALSATPAAACRFINPTETVLDADINTDGNEFRRENSISTDQYPFGFFHSDELNDLIHQNDGTSSECKSVRVYVGYDIDVHTIYRLKLVAFSVDALGNNVIMNDDGSAAIILEHSWPPN